MLNVDESLCACAHVNDSHVTTGRKNKCIFQNLMQLIICLQFHHLLCNLATNLRFLTPVELQTDDIHSNAKTREKIQ